MKITLPIVLLSLLFANPPATENDRDFVKTIAMVKRAVVPVLCLKEDENKNWILVSNEGTGFFVSDNGNFITAGHVAQGLYATGRVTPCPIPAIYVPIEGWKSQTFGSGMVAFNIIRCMWDLEVDVGLCKLQNNPFQNIQLHIKPLVVEFSNAIENDGTAIAFTGFPIGQLRPITSQGTIGAYFGSEALGARDFVIDKNAWPGSSGSPVYRIDEKVVGLIVQRGTNEGTGLAFARPAVLIEDFLSKHPFTEERKKD